MKKQRNVRRSHRRKNNSRRSLRRKNTSRRKSLQRRNLRTHRRSHRRKSLKRRRKRKTKKKSMKGGMNKAIDFAIHNPEIAATAATGAVATLGGLGVYAYDRYKDTSKQNEQKTTQEKLQKRLKEVKLTSSEPTQNTGSLTSSRVSARDKDTRNRSLPPTPPETQKRSEEAKLTSSGTEPNTTPSSRTQPDTITAGRVTHQEYLSNLPKKKEIATNKLMEAIKKLDVDNRMPIKGTIVFDCGSYHCEYVINNDPAINDGKNYYNMTSKSPQGKIYTKIPMSALIQGKILLDNFSIRESHGLQWD